MEALACGLKTIKNPAKRAGLSVNQESRMSCSAVQGEVPLVLRAVRADCVRPKTRHSGSRHPATRHSGTR